MKRRPLWAMALAGLLGCGASQAPESVELMPPGADVEIATEPPSPNAYQFVGEVTGVAAAKDIAAAEEAARNDLRNKAAAIGGVVVTIDSDVGQAVLLLGKTRVKVVGRAYKPVE